MTHFCEIHWTSGSIDEARKVSRYLVQERLVACAQIIPWIEAIFMWNNQLETAQESKVVFKTLKSHFKQIEEIIRANCTYEVPEILCFEIVEGNSGYMNWMTESIVALKEEASK